MTAGLLRSPAEPVDRLGEVLDLVEELTGLARAGEELARRIESVSGLRAGELQALAAVADGASHPRAVARRTGQVDEAGEATVGALLQRGLLARHRHPDAPPGTSDPALVHLTAAGRTVHAQAQGLRIRALAAVVQDLGEDRTDSLRTTVRALGTALGAGPGPVPAPRPPHPIGR